MVQSWRRGNLVDQLEQNQQPILFNILILILILIMTIQQKYSFVHVFKQETNHINNNCMYHSPRKITIHYQETMPLRPNINQQSPPAKYPPRRKLDSTKATSPNPSTTFQPPVNRYVLQQVQNRNRVLERQRQEYEDKIKMAIEQIDRLNKLLSVKSTQVTVLNSHCTKISDELKEMDSLMEVNRRLEEENTNLKAQLYRRDNVISSLSNKQLQLFSATKINCEQEEQQNNQTSQNSISAHVHNKNANNNMDIINSNSNNDEQVMVMNSHSSKIIRSCSMEFPNEQISTVNIQLKQKVKSQQQHIRKLQTQVQYESINNQEKENQISILMQKMERFEQSIQYMQEDNESVPINEYMTLKENFHHSKQAQVRLAHRIQQLQQSISSLKEINQQ